MGIITRKNTERTMRYAFDLARAKGKSKVTAVDKDNVIPFMYGLWREVFEDVAKEYPEITHENNFADACNMWFVKQPESYGVVVLPNLMGDIITDLGAAITGGLGFLLAIVLFASIRERLVFADYPKCWDGFPIALITAGLMALAFMGFSGLKVW